MFSRQQIIQQIRLKKSFLCIGLDTNPILLPDCLKDHPNPVMEFNRRIIDATHDLCIAYKPNTAFYECYGVKGWQNLQQTCNYIPDQVFKIADAKRGDIGNTSAMYAQAFFEPSVSGMNFDAVTVAPYMGADSVQPFLSFEGKWIILLALTSNSGSQDFQTLPLGDQQLFEKVISRAAGWASAENMMFVVGATRGESFKAVRKLAPDHFLLVPGVGAQGGSLAEVCKYGMNADCGLIVNASRSIIYASSEPDFADAARAEALRIREEMGVELTRIDFFASEG
ncbi:MAG: orotidine-5'-phosphate decarboxylase [Sphingobacteriaceae bacterium]